tara:strand:+ start:2045 stop:3121 length:1077 start_codon:yes stop_codon:yes gene_type:complete
MMRILAWVAGGLVLSGLIGFAAVWFSPGLQDALMRRVIADNTGTDEAVLRGDALHVVFCGTGSPVPDPDRAQACAAIYAGGKLFFIDAGLGGWNRMAAFRLPVGGVTGILFTHFHSDHISGLPDIALNTWAAGRRDPLTLYGPPGIRQVADGFAKAYELDNGWRIAHHGAEFFAVEGAAFRPVDVDVADPETGVTVYEQDGLKITAFLVSHEPVEPAYGYRIDYKDRSVVFSGDTMRDETVARMGKGADVMVHEALSTHMVGLIEEGLAAAGDRRAKVMHDIPSYHTTPVDAAKIANEAGVELLVLSHIVPRLPNAIAERVFMRGVGAVRGDGVMLGYDGLDLELPAGSGEIVQHDLR